MKVTATAVLKWVKQYAILNYEKPKPQQVSVVEIELDAMGHYLKSKQAMDLESKLSYYLSTC